MNDAEWWSYRTSREREPEKSNHLVVDEYGRPKPKKEPQAQPPEKTSQPAVAEAFDLQKWLSDPYYQAAHPAQGEAMIDIILDEHGKPKLNKEPKAQSPAENTITPSRVETPAVAEGIDILRWAKDPSYRAARPAQYDVKIDAKYGKYAGDVQVNPRLAAELWSAEPKPLQGNTRPTGQTGIKLFEKKSLIDGTPLQQADPAPPTTQPLYDATWATPSYNPVTPMQQTSPNAEVTYRTINSKKALAEKALIGGAPLGSGAATSSYKELKGKIYQAVAWEAEVAKATAPQVPPFTISYESIPGPRRTAADGFLFSPGERLADKYTITKQLTRGKTSEIYVVTNDRNASFALKVAVPSKFYSREDIGNDAYERLEERSPLERCRREWNILSELEHTMILKPIDLIERLPHDSAGLLLERIYEPKTLKEVISDLAAWQPWTFEACQKRSDAESILKRYGSTDAPDRIAEAYRACLSTNDQWRPDRIAKLERELDRLREFYQSVPLKVETAVNVIRKKGILHRDLKPENILIECNENVKILDFGASGKELDSEWGARTVRPPELHPPRWGKAHQNSDLWAVGLIAYEMAFGHHPFAPDGDTARIPSRVGQYAEISRAHENNGGIMLPFSHTVAQDIFRECVQSYAKGVPARRRPETARVPALNVGIDVPSDGRSASQARAVDYVRLLSYLAARPHERTMFETTYSPKSLEFAQFIDAGLNVPATRFYPFS